jgi:hypothetical protein
MKTLTRKESAALIRRLRAIRPDAERQWGRMTAHQMVCHLADACRMAIGTQQVCPTSSAFTRTIVKSLALYLPLRWRGGIVTSPEIDQCGGAGTKPSHFASDVADVERLLTELSTRGASADWPEHPVFGRMSHSQWMRWAYLHTDHHLRQFEPRNNTRHRTTRNNTRHRQTQATEQHTPRNNTEEHGTTLT